MAIVYALEIYRADTTGRYQKLRTPEDDGLAHAKSRYLGIRWYDYDPTVVRFMNGRYAFKPYLCKDRLSRCSGKRTRTKFPQ